MQFGLVSNCWRVQLGEGMPLEALIDEAWRRGYRAVELRQTCLGNYESGDESVPLAGALGELPARFPGMRFNVALALPVFGGAIAASDRVFAAGRCAALAVTGEFPPHLRLVDLQPTARQFDSALLGGVADCVARLARSLAEIDGILSMENSMQPWSTFRHVFESARRRLGADASRLRLCYDACNLLLPGDGVDPAAVTRSLSADEISSVHIKQRRDGRPLPSVCDGDIDWRDQLAALNEINYTGPALFEVESHARLWAFLDESREHLEQLKS